MAIIPLNISHSSSLNAICLITPSSTPTTEESVIILMDIHSNKLWYKKHEEIFPFYCLSIDYITQLYEELKNDDQALNALQDLKFSEAVEVYTKVAYGGITPKMIMELMN